MEKATVHIISHSHWDREWYMSFEKFRMRLVKLIDDVLDLLEAENNGFAFFHLDGHVLLVDDYLEIRPEQEARLRSVVRQGKLSIGPWYVLQDAFLTSGEAQIRNMQLGLARAEELGGATEIGYFPDTFGNISQSAQLLQGFGIGRAVFGRGINAIAENNGVRNTDSSGYPSELWWASPDGSRVLSVFLANWYHNGMELPTDPLRAAERGRQALDNVERFASTPHLLLMNGCDHQPVQSDVGQAIAALNEGLPAYRFVHSRFQDYFDKLEACEPPNATVAGELIGERTDGWTTLVNTASSRMYLKQWNTRVQGELERWAEPFSTIAGLLGKEYPAAFLKQAWKLLLQNHPHDSICGCSVDPVHEEMVTRFMKSAQIAEALSFEAMTYIADRTDTTAFAAQQSGQPADVYATDTKAPGTQLTGQSADAYPFVVFNPLGWTRDEWTTVDIDAHEELEPDRFALLDRDRAEVACAWEDLGWISGFTLPDDRFRIPWRKRRYRLTFLASGIPGTGHASFAWVRRKDAGSAPIGDGDEAACIVEPDSAILENAYLRIAADAGGKLTLEDKATGQVYRDLLALEDSGDIGNEYLYRAAEGAVPIVTGVDPVRLVDRSTAGCARLAVLHRLDLPAEREGSGRTARTVSQEIEVAVSLKTGAKYAEIVVSLDNAAKDHRLRALFPSDADTAFVRAAAPFDVVKRSIAPWEGWRNPSRNERMQSFVDVSDGVRGLAIVTEGLPEYEALRDGRGTIALTLLRCVGELGDWNYFPTPGAQCLGPYSCRFAIVPHGGDYREVVGVAQSFNAPLRAVPTGVHGGPLPSALSWASVESPGGAVVTTALKRAEDAGGAVLRLVNLGESEERVTVKGRLFDVGSEVSERMLNERVAADAVPVEAGPIAFALAPKKILTLGIKDAPAMLK
ncbi:alpha-mannosidase [Cohnella hashimotonis]|uniref:Glycoside hydrolase family 38 C-terminal domain-containing protein n=1 Tax=Cohnella hashimotonis TaxID=2826895 RepID=A0ABT6TBU4_9BACL|nr:glycoside hydrolase family 38 C-terminal domain-containing protein [Cohnella hashimotonis]MDI4643778.1 glycoside hydrolase family 38 C-terminal domain-containing protein [Cohnella hashimotonis]